jgi:hypothetical protein
LIGAKKVIEIYIAYSFIPSPAFLSEKAMKAKSERDMKYALRKVLEIIKFINILG